MTQVLPSLEDAPTNPDRLDLFLVPEPDAPTPGTFGRILLTTDGTVTDILEAYAGEPIRVEILGQGFETTPPEVSHLDTDGAERLLHRTVLLRGRTTGITFLHADTFIAPGRLPRGVVDGLLKTGKPIGHLLTERRIESFREIIKVGYQAAGECAAHFGVDPSTTLVYRTYHIIIKGRPALCITEKFPVSRFSEPIGWRV
jgi:chorismate-pyruvate lyase